MSKYEPKIKIKIKHFSTTAVTNQKVGKTESQKVISTTYL